MTEEEGHDQDSADNICGALEAERKSEHGDPEGLMDAIQNGSGLIADVGVELLSAVDLPAVDSTWVMTKSADATDGHDFRVAAPVLLSKQDDGTEDQRISYASAMVPREPDKEGDVVATPTVEKAAHNFLKADDAGVDTDHSLIDGEGEVVESWVLKERRTFDLPGGETKTYGPGVWMVGIEWGADAWSRVKSGELTGISIYGMAEHVPLSRAATCAECGGALTAAKSQNGDTHKGDGGDSTDMGDEQPSDNDGDDGPDVAELAASVDDLADTVSTVSDDLETVKEAVDTAKQDEQELAAELGDVYDLPPGDVLDILNAAAGHDASEVLSAIDSLSEQEPVEDSADEEAKEDDDDDEDDDEMESSVDKRADDANLGKGGNAQGTAAKGIESGDPGSDGLPSYAAAAEQESD